MGVGPVLDLGPSPATLRGSIGDRLRMSRPWASIIRLVGAVLAEQHDEWAEGRCYPGLDVLTRAQAVHTANSER